MLEVELGGLSVVIVRVEGTVYALSGECPHQGGPLVEGDLQGSVLTCPWHAFSFDAKTGSSLDPEVPDCMSYPVRVSGNDLQLHTQPAG